MVKLAKSSHPFQVFHALDLYKRHIHPIGFYRGHQCSLTLTPADSM